MGLFDRIRRAVGGDDSSTDGNERTAEGNRPSDDGPDRLDTAALDPTTFREYAEHVVDGADPLTFDPNALARLDTAIDESYGGETVGDTAETTTYTENTIRFGSYLGELLVRAYDGEWVQSDGRWGVTVAGPDGKVTVAVFDVAARSFGDEPVFAAVVTRLESELTLDSRQRTGGDRRADPDTREPEADNVVSEPTRIVSRVDDEQTDERDVPPEPTATDERGVGTAGDSTDSAPSQAVETEPTRIVKRVELESEADDRSDDTDPTPVTSAVDDEPENEPLGDSDDPDSNESADPDITNLASEDAGSEPPVAATTEEELTVDPSDTPAADDTTAERSADDTVTEWLADDAADEQPTVETPAEESAVDDSVDEPAVDTTEAVDTATDAAAADEPAAYIDEAESSFDSATASSSDDMPAAETPPEDSAVDSRDKDGGNSAPARATTDIAADDAATDTADDASTDASMDDEPTPDSSPDASSDAVPDTEAAAETTAAESPVDIADAGVGDAPAAVSDPDTTDLSGDSPNTSAPVADVDATDTSEHAAPQDVTAGETAATADTDESDLFAHSDSDSPTGLMARPWDSGTVRADHADTAVEFADFWGEHDLDFSPASLSRLDDLVDAEWDDERFAETTFRSDMSFDDRAFTSVVRELGGYFGEVLVRHLDGEWTDQTDHEAAVVVGGPAGEFAVPVFEVAITSLRKQAVFGRSYDALLDDLGRDGPAR